MDFNSQDSQEIMKNFKSIIGSRLEKLDNEKGADGELYAYSIAVANQKKKKAKETPQDITMENNRLREMVIDALTEKKKSSAFTPEYDDKFTDKRKNLPDGLQKSILKKQGKLGEVNLGHNEISSIHQEGGSWIVSYRTMDGKKEKVFQSEDEAKEFTKTLNEDLDLDQDNVLGDLISDMLKMGKSEDEIIQILKQKITSYFADPNLNEDLDLGHEDNEPHMVKADLYKIGKYAMELYQIVDQFEGQGEVDFPAWWQSKITNAASMISSAKHYLEFELKEPEIDAMVGVAQNTGAIDEIKAKVLARLTKK